MASYFFRNTGNSNWGTSTNWSLTDGGGATGAVPTATDDAFFSNNSGNCIVDAAGKVCLTLDFTKGTGFTGTFTCTNTLTVSGNITLNGAMTYAGAAVLTINASATITSNGITITSSVTCSGINTTITLADDMHISGGTFLPSASTGMVYSGAFTIFFSGTVFTSNNAMTSANTKLEFTGNVTLASQQGIGFNEIRINTGTNTFTCNSTMNIGSSTNTTTLTYVSGGVNIGTACNLAAIGSITYNTYPMKWAFIDFNNSDNNARTLTINSPLLASTIKLGGSSAVVANTVFAGSYGFVTDIFYLLTANTAKGFTLSAGATYQVNTLFMIGSNLDSMGSINFNTSVSGQKAKILTSKFCQTSLMYVSMTDIDNIGPNRIPIFQHPSATNTLTNSAGWYLIPSGQSNIKSVGFGGLNQGVTEGLF